MDAHESSKHGSSEHTSQHVNPSTSDGPSMNGERRTPRNDETAEQRSDRLARIKAAVEAGDYETPEKLEIALERMLGGIGVDVADDA